MPEDLSSQNGSISIYGSILGDSNVLSRETRDVLELGLAALAFGTPAASEAGSIYGSMRGGSMFGSTRGSVTGHQHPSPAVQRAAEHSDRRSSPPVRPDPRDFGHSLNESAIAAAAEKTPVPVSPAFPGDQGSAHVANPTEEEIRRAVQADVADFVSDIAGVSGGQAQVKAAVSPRPQLAQEADLTPEEVAEREAIRREIQDKMAAMRRQSQANPSQAISVSPPRAVTSPVASPPRAVKSPVASPVLMQQQAPIQAAPKSGSTVTSIRDGDVFWRDLLNDLQLVDNDLDAMNRNLKLSDLDDPYRNKSRLSRPSPSLGVHEYSALTGSYPSSLISSRSPSPSALDNPVSAAAKRETLLGASLSSDYDYGSSRGGWDNDGDYHGDYSTRSGSRGSQYHRRPDLGSNWQRDLDLIGSQALEALNRPAGAQSQRLPHGTGGGLNQSSHTDALIQQMRGVSGAAPQHRDLIRSAYQAPRPAAYSDAAGANERNRTTEAPGNLRVRCIVGDAGATAYVTWSAAWEAWAPVVRVNEVTFEVQMIVRWLPGQTWNTIFTVTEPHCTVNGLKPRNPFAVRVRAIAKNWCSDYTQPFEFVTEQSQASEEVAAEVSAAVSQASRDAQRTSHQAASTNTHSKPLHQTTYLERLLESRQAKVEIQARADSALQQQQQAPVDVRTLSPVRTLVPVAARESGSMRTLSPAHGSHVVLQAQRMPAPQHVAGHMAPARTADPFNVTSRQVLQPVEHATQQQTQQTNSSAPPATEAKAAEVPTPIVRRIKLDDPENPHYKKMQQLTPEFFPSRREVARREVAQSPASAAPQPAPSPALSSSGPPMAHPGATEMYGSIYQAQRSVPIMEPAQEPQTSSSNGQALGPLARALGVMQYQEASVLEESKLARAVAQPVTSTHLNLPLARAVRVSAKPIDSLSIA